MGKKKEIKLSGVKMQIDNGCTVLNTVRDRTDLEDVPLAQQMLSHSSASLRKMKEEYCRVACTHFEDTCARVDYAIDEAERTENERRKA
jgi:hypothetical protein